MKLKLTLLAFALMAAMANAHQGHDTPGALPPPPNGGRMAEAAHTGGDHHGGKPEAELYLEAKLEGTKLKLFPHALGPTDMNAFKALKPGAGLTLTELKMELPRSKKTTILKSSQKDGFWESEIGQLSERRLMIWATVMEGSEKKTAKIQIEK